MTIALLLLILVLLPAVVAFLSERSIWQPGLPVFSVGTPVVYRQEEISTRPAPNARDVRPAERGEYYYYTIINYLRVAELLGDGRIIAIARNHERLCLSPHNSSLRKARLTERLIYRFRFPHS